MEDSISHKQQIFYCICVLLGSYFFYLVTSISFFFLCFDWNESNIANRLLVLGFRLPVFPEDF